MQIRTIVRRSVAGTCALALTTVGFVAVPGVASASPQCIPMTIAAESVDLGPLNEGALLCLDYSIPLDGFVALGATDTGRAEGDQDVFANWITETSTLMWTVPAARDGVQPEIDLDTNDAGVFVATYSWEQAPIDPGPSDPPVDPPAAVLPAAPTAISATPDTLTTLALSWSGGVGGDNGFDHYIVAWYVDGQEVGLTTTTLESITLDGLDSATAYDVRVWTVDTAEAMSADYAQITTSPSEPPLPDPDPSSSSPEPPASVDPVADGPFDAVAGVEATHDVLGNDPQGSTGPSVVNAPEHGTAFFDQDGLLHYTPTEGYTGADSLTYAIDGTEVTAGVDFTVAAYVPLGAPTSFTTTAVGINSISVSWAAPEAGSTRPLDHYRVWWWNIDHWVYELPTVGTTWTFTDLLPSTTYQFRVTAVDTLDVNSSLDAVMEPTTAAFVAPGMPQQLYRSATTETSFTWDWGAAEQGTYDIASYTVRYKRTFSEDEWTVLTIPVGTHTVTASDLPAGVDYTYEFWTNDVEGNESQHGIAWAATSDHLPQLLAVPENLHVVGDPTTTSVDLAWDAAVVGDTPLAGYQLQFTDLATEEGWARQTAADTTTWTETQLLPGHEYSVTVMAYDEDDYWTEQSTAVPFTTAPESTTPVNDPVTAYTQRTWDFDVLANDPGDPTSAEVVDAPTAGHVTWTGTVFQYAVDDPQAVGDSFTYRNNVSNEIATVLIDIAVPTAWVMGDIEATATGSTTIDVTWTEPEPGTFPLYGYFVYWTDGGAWSHSARILGTSYTIEGLDPDTEYIVTVKSSDGTNLSTSPRVYPVTDPADVAVPTTPTNFVAEAAGSDSVDLSWDASEFPGAELDCYEVYYRVVGDDAWQYADCTADTFLTVEGLDPETDYEFAVTAWDFDEYQSDWAYAYATTDAGLPPAPVRPQITTPDAIVTGGTAQFEISMVSEDAVVEAGDLADGVAAVDVDGLTVTVTTVRGFSGTLVQPLLVTDGADPIEIEATVVVNPAAASRATYRITSATTSRVLWTTGAGATGYVVKVGGTTVCTTAQATCLVPRLLGPVNVVTVIATGHDSTVGTTARAAYVSTAVNFGHVHFVGDSPVLTRASAIALRTLTAKLMAAGVTRLTVHGYTATLGTATRTPVQLKLSAMRANAVAANVTAYYTAHGKTVRIVRVAEGAAHPIASNATYAGRAENRRAEVVLG